MRRSALTVIAVLGCTVPAFGGAHTWDVNEIFSNADGTIQFIELMECCGGANEVGLANKFVASQATGSQYTFPSNLPAGTTAHAHVLLATAGFAALPGAPTPDHIINDNFIDVSSDSIDYYVYDTLTFAMGSLPVDGIHSLNGDGSTGINSPTNFDGEGGSVNLPCLAADTNGDLEVDVNDLNNVILDWGTDGAAHGGDIAGPNDSPPDGVVDVNDLVSVFVNWGACS